VAERVCYNGVNMSEWKKARKKPLEIEYRGVDGLTEAVHTHEGILLANKSKDYIIRGVQGELYPIKKDIFAKTYDVISQ